MPLSKHLIRVSMLIMCPLLVQSQEKVAEKASLENGDDNSYILARRDILTISVFDEKDLTTNQPIDGNNEIKVPLIGKIKVGGMTVREAEAFLEEEFITQEYLRDPLVTIKVQSRKEVFVLGEINSPGAVTFNGDVNSLNIIQLIAKCGSFTKIANEEKVQINRRLFNGIIQSFIIDVKELMREDKKRGDKKIEFFEVKPGDIVYVPQRFM